MSVEFFMWVSMVPITIMIIAGPLLSIAAFAADEPDIKHPGTLLAGLLLTFFGLALLICGNELSKRLTWEREAREAVAVEAGEGK